MKQLYIIGFLLFFSGLCGCYEDKGNYDYTETFEITIDSLKELYAVCFGRYAAYFAGSESGQCRI